MACYAVGDLQGCLDPLQRLLDRLRFDPASDCLWLTGDLVNRGPQSLESLRFVRDLGASAVTVLGNHDLHLLSLHARGVAGTDKVDPTLVPVLRASDRDELLVRAPVASQHGLDFGGAAARRGQIPARWQAGMNQGVAQGCIVVWLATGARTSCATCTATNLIAGRLD